MKFFSIALALLPFAFALEPEIVSLQPESPIELSDIGTNQLTDDNEPLNEFVEDLDLDNPPETVEEVVESQWDAGPEQAIKKKSLPKRGQVIKPLIVLTKEFKNAIVMAHNRARSTTIPPASNMRKMMWDNSLERLATTYSRKCIYEHNPNPKHRRFSYVGENLFISMGLPYEKNLLDHAVRAWDGEKNVYNYDQTKCQRGKVCGHYTQVVWADSFKVGCGVTRCRNINVRGKIWKSAILFGCNYGPGGNYRNEKPYKTGRRCSQCDKRDRCRKNLCANTIRDRVFFDPKIAKWTPWSKWSACSKTCGMGSKRRQRTCNTYVPTDCKGFASEVRFCMNAPCASNQGTFEFDVILNEGDNFMQDSILDILKGKGGGNFFTRKTTG